MASERERSAISWIGYATGTGIVGVALVGVPLQFAYPDLSSLLTYGGAFAVGAAVGAALAGWRGVRI